MLHRSDIDQYQFVAGGGEDDEQPIEAAAREIYEETSVKAGHIVPLTSMVLGSGEKGHSESGEKGHFSVRKKGPTHQRLFYSDYWLLATMESSFTGLHS